MRHDGCILSRKGIKSRKNLLLTFIKSVNVMIQCMEKGNGGGVVLMDGLTEFPVACDDGLEQANVMG